MRQHFVNPEAGPLRILSGGKRAGRGTEVFVDFGNNVADEASETNNSRKIN